MKELTIHGTRGSQDITKVVRIRKERALGGYIVEWGTGSNKKIGTYAGGKLTTMPGTRLITVLNDCWND